MGSNPATPIKPCALRDSSVLNTMEKNVVTVKNEFKLIDHNPMDSSKSWEVVFLLLKFAIKDFIEDRELKKYRLEK